MTHREIPDDFAPTFEECAIEGGVLVSWKGIGFVKSGDTARDERALADLRQIVWNALELVRSRGEE